MDELVLQILNMSVDEAIKTVFSEDYPLNPYGFVTAAEKLGFRNLAELGMRASCGTKLHRGFGSPQAFSPWEKIFLNPRQIFCLPTANTADMNTKVSIGPDAKKPLNLDIPIMITGMSYGGSLSLPLKVALAKSSASCGTATNTGESSVTSEERQNAKYIVGQYNRYGVMRDPQKLRQVDAIEVQLGQGAFGGAVESVIKSVAIDDHLRNALGLGVGEDAVRTSRIDNISDPNDIIDLVNGFKNNYDVPVGVKIAGSDFIEYELDILSETDADFLVVDGAEGGTAKAPPALQDNLGLPTLYSLTRAIDWLTQKGLRDRYSVIAAGGLCNPGHFLKALAIGADAVYIGSAAVFAALSAQITESLPLKLPTQVALYEGAKKDQLDIDKAALGLQNFISSCMEEMVLACQALGKTSLSDLGRDDLVSVDKDLSDFMGIRYAASARKEKEKVLL